MLIKSLEEMEAIVENNKALSWDGWTVVERTKSDVAWMQSNAQFVNGRWFAINKYFVNQDGWNIPSKLVKKNAK
jgi:hypothetical protein